MASPCALVLGAVAAVMDEARGRGASEAVLGPLRAALLAAFDAVIADLRRLAAPNASATLNALLAAELEQLRAELAAVRQEALRIGYPA